MAVVTIREPQRVLRDAGEIATFLETYGIWYRHFDGLAAIDPDATDEQILELFDEPIREQMQSGGFATADVVSLRPTVPGLEAMLDKFRAEHWHSEDEVRFIVEGSGVFHINPRDAPVFAIEVHEGDMISVPQGTYHWFDLCEDRRIRAVRLFQDQSGWTPHYSESGEEARHEPLCMGPSFVPPASSNT